MSKFQYEAVAFDSLGVEIMVPDPEQVKEAYEKGILKPFPYWSRIWPSSVALASWLHNNSHVISGKRLVEIGAGIGFPSFVAARDALSVQITDHIPEAIAWLEMNIIKQGSNHISAALLDWREKSIPEADVVLMSDIGYHEEDFVHVHDMIRRYVGNGTIVLLTVPARLISARFIIPLEEFVLQRELISAMDTEIMILVLGATDSLLPVRRTNN